MIGDSDARWELRDIVQRWANNLEDSTSGFPNHGIRLAAVDETSNATWRKYRATNYGPDTRPRMEITYDSVPVFSGSLGVSPCMLDCNKDWRSTTTTTPSLSATATDVDGDSLTYNWEIRAEDTTTVLSTASIVKAAGSTSTWAVPAGILEDGKVYEFRTVVSDGTTSISSNWNPLAVDVQSPPAAPTEVTVSPCVDPCTSFATTSRVPIISATVDDPDSSFVAAQVEVRAQGQTSLLASGSSEPVGPGTVASYAVPAGAITADGNYEFRVAASDGTSFTWGAWTPLPVAAVAGLTEPGDFTVSTCVAPCQDWTATSLTPTLQAVNRGATISDLTFEIRGNDGLSRSSTAAPVAGGAVGNWTVPAGLLAAGGGYEVRAGASDGNGNSMWTAWTNMTVSSSVNDAGTPQILEGDSADSTTVAADPGEEAGTAAAYGDADVLSLDTSAKQDAISAGSAGLSEDSPEYSARGVSIPMKYAPKLTLHFNEEYFPMSATTFIKNSKLNWSHDSDCNDHDWGYNPDQSNMGTGAYQHQEANSFCLHSGATWRSDGDVAPYAHGGPSGLKEGMHLNLLNSLRDGDDLRGDEPVYYRYEPKSYLMYWFHYGFSKTDVIGPTNGSHEGDWERIAIKLHSDTNAPVRVQYFHHYESCTLPWKNVPKAETYHPSVWVAKNSHGSYPAGNHSQDGYGLRVIDRMSGSGPDWWATRNLQNVEGRLWYGYGGGWGAIGKLGEYFTGPSGPSAYKGGKPGFASPACEFN